MRIISLLSVFIIAGFMFTAIGKLHDPGKPLGNAKVFSERSSEKTDLKNVTTMDDYYLRNGQRETGSNNIVTSVVFDYRGFDTLGEAAVLFLVVTSISMLLFSILKEKDLELKVRVNEEGFPLGISRIVSVGAALIFPVIITFGAYLVIHGHLTPGGGFQGGAVMATGTALLVVSSYIARNILKTYKMFSSFESVGLVLFIGTGFLGIGVSFLNNFLANSQCCFFGQTVDFGSNPGFLNSGGILPILSTAVGIEVFCGISIILILLNRALNSKESGRR